MVILYLPEWGCKNEYASIPKATFGIRRRENASFPNLDGYVMGVFKKEYRDAIIIKRMLREYSVGGFSK